MAEERTWANCKQVKPAEEQKEEDYAFIEEYREIDEEAKPGDIIYGTMPTTDKEIGKLNANLRVLSPYPATWSTEQQPYPEALTETIDNLSINC